MSQPKRRVVTVPARALQAHAAAGNRNSRITHRAAQAGQSRVQALLQNLDHKVKETNIKQEAEKPKKIAPSPPKEITDYHCPVCNKKLQCAARVLEHVAAVHEEQRIYDCFYCDVTYKYKSNLRAHIKKKHTQETHCPKCLGKEFDQFPDLVKHLMESHNDKSQAPLKFANYDEKSKPVKPEKRLDPGVPIARKTITHKSNGNADGFGAPNFNTVPTGQRTPSFGVPGIPGSPTPSNHSSATNHSSSEFQTPNFGQNTGQNTFQSQNSGFQSPSSYSSHTEPPRRQIAFKTIVPLKRTINASKSPEQLKPTIVIKPKPKPVIYMRNLRLTTPKTTEQLIQQYSTPGGGGAGKREGGGDQVGSGNELNGVNTSFSSASSVTSENKEFRGTHSVQIEAPQEEDPNDMLYGVEPKRGRYDQNLY